MSAVQWWDLFAAIWALFCAWLVVKGLKL